MAASFKVKAARCPSNGSMADNIDMTMIFFKFSSQKHSASGRVILCAIAVLAMLGTIADAAAQIRLPPVRLPTPGIGGLPDVVTPLRNSELSVETRKLIDARLARQRELVRQNGNVLELDPAGAPVRRAQLLAIGPSAQILAAIAADGFRIIGERELAELELKVFILQPPAGLALATALARLRGLDPAGTYDYNHIYSDSGVIANRASATPGNASSRAVADADSPAPTNQSLQIGLIDGGVDRSHPVLTGIVIKPWGCAGKNMISAHGTAVASLLVGKAGKFQGVIPGAMLYAADVYCGTPTGGAVDSIVDALAWMAREHIAVINLSLVGPPNLTLERVLKILMARGHIVVAAAGNDGPAAPPLYPAAYAGVIAVTAVDARARVLPEACRGPHIAFAAPGSDMVAARVSAGVSSGDDGHLTNVRGTSFAAPIVAAMLARELGNQNRNQNAGNPDPAGAAAAIAALVHQATDLGARGRDPIYGYGLVGMEYRNLP